MTDQEKNKGGRPRIEIDLTQVEKMCALRCTADEIAGFLGVSMDALIARIKEAGYKGFPDFFKSHSASGNVSLRRWQWEKAKKGNVTMLIWLGKQYLGQSDKQELTGQDGGPLQTSQSIEHRLDLSDLSDEEVKLLESIGAKVKADQDKEEESNGD